MRLNYFFNITVFICKFNYNPNSFNFLNIFKAKKC